MKRLPRQVAYDKANDQLCLGGPIFFKLPFAGVLDTHSRYHLTISGSADIMIHGRAQDYAVFVSWE